MMLLQAGWILAAHCCFEWSETAGKCMLDSMDLEILNELVEHHKDASVIQQMTSRAMWLRCKHPPSVLKSEWNWGFIQAVSRLLWDPGHSLHRDLEFSSQRGQCCQEA